MLIGLNVSGVHRAITEIAGLPGEPVARLTPLGWSCIGPADPSTSIASNFAHFAYFVKTESDVDSLLRISWELETAGVQSGSPNYSKSELEAIKSTEDTLTYDPIEKRYTVGVPWKSNQHLVTSNYENAETRLLSLERSLRKQPEVSMQYSVIIRQHIAKGFITEVMSHSVPSWYLPHFAVVRMDKSTSKVRMVLDAAACSHGVSLNDCINPGPKLQRELLDVLLRFRNKPIALASDISEMFLQIKLKDDDCQYHRILWREMDPLRPVKIYQYNRLVFGNSSSPFLSQAVLRENCKQNMDEYPLAAQSILDSMYVDDLLDSVDTLSEAIELRRQLTSLLSKAGFEIRKWLSNNPEVLSDIPISDRLNKLSLDDGNLPSVKTLGILWKAENDLFTFDYTEPTFDRLTKRVVVSKTATLFDPLTLIAPFTIRAKLGIQKTWVRGIDWDDELPDDLAQQWRLWFSELSLLNSIAIPRCLIKDGSEVVRKTLHVFVDASEKAYAACCYLRCEYRNGPVTVALVVAKTRVAPLKAVSIPKLELCGALLGVRLSTTVCEVLSIPKELLTFWCDSQNVLYWIKGESRSYKPFVSHRIGEIHDLTEPIQWRYVPTKQNSADLATRGVSVIELAHCDMWWYGPEFLATESSKWPERVIPKPEEVALSEVRSNASETFLAIEIDLGRLDPLRFSNWTRLVRVSAWVLRFIFNTRNPRKRVDNSNLNVDELQNSRSFWIKFAQNEIFASEIDCVRKSIHVKSNSKLLPLNPCLDERGLLRVRSRIENAEHLEYNAKFPIILPSNHVISRLIVGSYHDENNHDIGVSHLLSILRTTFWIVGGRNLIKSVKSNCAECRRRRRKPAVQVMAPLPAYRLGSPLRAFARVGIDYTGPFLTKQGRGKSRAKRYLCLFTCLATRAVHLEMSWSMDTESFLCAFSRFTNRRGKPLSVLSDNGTNFVGAERELRDLLHVLDQSKIHDSLANSKIEWNFNPPLSPHFGGVFEAMIKSAKRAIRAIIGSADVTDEELSTAFIKAEGLINTRPLCYQGDDSNDDPVLTPNNFIFGQISGQLAPESVDHVAFDPRKRWRHVQEVIHQFWKRWMREFLPLLNSRKTWNRVHRDFVEGDLAIVVDPANPRGKWPLGRIVKIYHGSDNHVRVVDIKVGDKVYKRSLSHLCPLDV